jgi:hypothetical protein
MNGEEAQEITKQLKLISEALREIAHNTRRIK